MSYPPEWPEVSLRTKIEAGFRCVRCGHPNGRLVLPGNDVDLVAILLADAISVPVQSFRFYRDGDGATWIRSSRIPCDGRCTHDPNVVDWRILTVHHLDGDKSNLAWWNLMSACQRCHLEIQGRVKMDQAYLHPHSEWFRPYVAGYYAHRVAGESLTRAEVEARLPELLALGQPHLADLYAETVA